MKVSAGFPPVPQGAGGFLYGAHVLAENTPGQAKRRAFSPKTQQGGKKRHRVVLPQRESKQKPKFCCSPNAKAGSKQKIVRSPTRFCQTAKRRCLSQRIFPERQFAVPCPDTFSPNGKMPLLA
ncbi:MAG: hypothetical protein K2N31_07375 [Treponemataceae bacterium]|nr:hypothetical protein [Treponemataceae bacterium]